MKKLWRKFIAKPVMLGEIFDVTAYLQLSPAFIRLKKPPVRSPVPHGSKQAFHNQPPLFCLCSKQLCTWNVTLILLYAAYFDLFSSFMVNPAGSGLFSGLKMTAGKTRTGETRRESALK